MNWYRSERAHGLLVVALGLMWGCGDSSHQNDGRDDDTGIETDMLTSTESSDSSKGDDSGTSNPTMSDSSGGDSQVEASGEGTAGDATESDTSAGESMGETGGETGETGGETGEIGETGESSTSGDTGTGGESGESTTEDECPELNVAFEKVTPNVHLIIDRSGSMKYDFVGSQSRWDAVKDVLVGAQDNIVESLQSDVRFAMTLYTGTNDECPIVSNDPIDEVALDNYISIRDLFDSENPGGGTPTGESIDLVANKLNQLTEPGPKLMVLATDGKPYTCEQLEGENSGGEQATIDAVNAAYANGIETYVISVGTNISEMHLQDVANAGRGVQPGGMNQPFYQATDRDALIDAFEEIINGVRPCKFTLDQEIRPGWEDKGEITINGTMIPYQDPNGWQVNSSTEIELLGDACQDIKSGDVEVKVDFSCEAIIPG